MIFSLDVRRARKGDCLLLHFGSRHEPGLVMIDGGPRGVYAPHLRPRLEEIRRKRVDGNKPLQIDLLMVSHVDDDHIQGILELTSELRTTRQEQRPALVQILDLWHNSFENIIGHTPAELTASVQGQFGPASLAGGGEFPDDQAGEVEETFAAAVPDATPDEARELVASSLKVLASIGQGAQLRHDADRLEVPLNVEFDGRLIIAEEGAPPIDMGGGLTFRVIGPMKAEVEALRKKHDEWLQKLEREGKSPAEVLAAYVDKSVANLSSLVLLAELGGKTMLLTGDARGDKILEGLEFTRTIAPGGTLEVDLLKVPHHGSSNNLDDDFFERVTARHYVFSGDGEHGNPERESLEMLFRARGDADYTVHLTYPIAKIDEERAKDWEKERAKETRRQARHVRPEWSPQEHGLRALLDANPALARKVRIVDAAAPHVIDLLEELGI